MPASRQPHGQRRRQPSRARERELLEARARRVDVPASADVAVVGGGAAGLACAIAAAEAGARTVVLERDLACGRTILATGNGRCNFCNEDLGASHYNDPHLAREVMGEAGEALGRVLGFFRESGLAWVTDDGRLYPRSRQAASVRNVLLRRASRAGVVLAPAREVVSLEPGGGPDGNWSLGFRGPGDTRGTLAAATVVLCMGGGQDDLARGLGLPLVSPSPVLCPLACEAEMPGLLDELDGRRAGCRATLLRGDAVIATGGGEALFRPYGLSGIVAFDLSRHALPGDSLVLDLLPGLAEDEARGLADACNASAVDGTGTSCLDGMLDPAIAAALLGACGGDTNETLACAKALRLAVTGLAETNHAQVTRGGIDARAIDPASMCLHGNDGLFACGEALDIDGACGGYNLAWAWLSGLRAGESAARSTREKGPRGQAPSA